ncbi:MAG: hypothetical protein FWH26_01350 [Oscillospiraceae bacterium]|nr:hypothetical protein [Oscillospiraceae bacterium]
MRTNQNNLSEAEMDDVLGLLDSCLPSSLPNGTGSAITEKQLRALSKKHLLMMIYDLEKELEQERREKEFLLRAR